MGGLALLPCERVARNVFGKDTASAVPSADVNQALAAEGVRKEL